MEIPACPHCGATISVRGWGRNGTRRRYYWQTRQRCFTPDLKEQGHGAADRAQAVELYLEGMSQRAIGRLLGVVHQSLAGWVTDRAATLPADPVDHPRPMGRGRAP